MTLPSPAPIFGPQPRIVVAPEIPSISRVFVLIPVQIVQAGVAVDPTTKPWSVDIAFVSGDDPTVHPVTGDWHPAEWYREPRVNVLATFARQLIGPGGTVALGIGTWLPWVRYDTGVELPVFPATGPVKIT